MTVQSPTTGAPPVEGFPGERAWLAAIVESSSDAIIGKSLDGIVWSWNRAAERMYGYRAEEIVGRSIRTIVPPDRVPEFDEVMRRVRRGGRVPPFETVRVRKDGSRIEISLTVSPILTPDGTIRGASAIASDRTEHRRDREAIAAANRDLRLLLHVVSHDLREPLRSCEGFSGLLLQRYRDRPLDERGVDFLGRIRRAALRMHRLLDEIVALSRAHRVELPDVPVAGSEIADRVVDRLGDRIAETGATVRVSGDLPPMRAEPAWTEEALYNLVVNALTHGGTGERPPEIEIAAPDPGPDGATAAGFVVRDRGPGVPAGHEDRVFEPFRRGPNRRSEGTGAGLAIVRAVAERHGGHATYRPRPGGGAEFVVTFGSGDR